MSWLCTLSLTFKYRKEVDLIKTEWLFKRDVELPFPPFIGLKILVPVGGVGYPFIVEGVSWEHPDVLGYGIYNKGIEVQIKPNGKEEDMKLEGWMENLIDRLKSDGNWE